MLEQLPPSPVESSKLGHRLAPDVRRGQPVALLRQNLGSQLFRSDAPGVWNELAFPQLAAGQREPNQLLGFDADGKLFVLVDPNAAVGQASTTAAYERRAEP